MVGLVQLTFTSGSLASTGSGSLRVTVLPLTWGYQVLILTVSSPPPAAYFSP